MWAVRDLNPRHPACKESDHIPLFFLLSVTCSLLKHKMDTFCTLCVFLYSDFDLIAIFMPKLQPTIYNLRDTTLDAVETLLLRSKFMTAKDAFRHIWTVARQKHNKCGFDNDNFAKALKAFYHHRSINKNVKDNEEWQT